MWNGKTLSVVLPTYNEKDSIADVHPALRGARRGRRGHRRQQQRGAGHLRGGREDRRPRGDRDHARATARRSSAGLREADTDLVAVCEPDGTFNPEDLRKLLAFMPECDFVVGSRTVSNFIWDGANMGWFLQWGNWAVAKLIEVLYNTSYLSDVGCTFRVMTREQAAVDPGPSTLDGSAYGLEMLLIGVIIRARMVQVPVNYHPRVGVSSVTGDFGKTIQLGLEMIGLILGCGCARAIRRGRYRGPGRPSAASPTGSVTPSVAGLSGPERRQR